MSINLSFSFIVPSPCSSSEYLCASGSCIPNTDICNGRHDCGDASDEDWRASCSSKNRIRAVYVSLYISKIVMKIFILF